MKEYNWEERNIIRMPGEIALHTEDLHVYYGDNEAIKGVDLEFEKIDHRFNWTFWLWKINLSTFVKSDE